MNSYKLEILLTPQVIDNVDQYFWAIYFYNKKTWANIACGWEINPNLAFQEAMASFYILKEENH